MLLPQNSKLLYRRFFGVRREAKRHAALAAWIPNPKAVSRWPCASPSATALKHSQSAFTLIELMVVMMLIGILTAMIIPEMRGTYEDALLRSSSRKLVNAFTLANARAIGLSQIHRVRLDRKAGRFYLERKAREDESRRGFVPVENVPGGAEAGVLDTRIAIEFHRPVEGGPDNAGPVTDRRNQAFDETISFYPDGTAEPGEILLRDRQGFALALRINPVTARVQIFELERR